jgi:hypothetical protein
VRNALDQRIYKMARSYNETTLHSSNVLSGKLTQEGGTNLTQLTNAVDGVYSRRTPRRPHRQDRELQSSELCE